MRSRKLQTALPARKQAAKRRTGERPPAGVTPPKQIPLPPLHRATVLPVHAVGSVRFEHLCRDLVEEEYPDNIVRTSLKRKSGLAQYGVDVEGFDAEGEPAVLVSAKCYEQVKASYFKGWLLDFTKHLGGHWKGRRIQFFILAVATETNDDDINEAVRQAAGELKPHGIEFRLWNANTITRRLRYVRALVDQYFHPVWASAISAEPATSASLIGSTSPGLAIPGWLQQAMTHVEGVSGGLGKAMASSLDAALVSVRSGRSEALRGWYEDSRTHVEAWDVLDPEVKARALRAVAMLRLHEDDLAGAGELLDEADLLPAPPDASSRARYVRATHSADGALALLDDPRTPQERETKAVILIESGRVAEADIALSAASGEEITPEILRLRAIVRLLTGHISEAIADARSAVERAPGDLAPLLTRATVRFHAALVTGARPQVGRAPEPVQPGLVREGAGARAELSAAADEFALVANLAEDDLRPDIEVWRLAALLLNPARAEEGAVLARKLLDAPLPEPLAIAWALSFGIVDRPGRLKRVLGAALRNGQATESHLVVLALLCAGPDNSKRGLEQIRRHEGRFPAASEFLEGWRARFGDPNASGGASGIADHAIATRHALRTGDFEPVIASALADAANVETLFLTAELLAWRGEWAGLNRLRTPLSALPTVRALELAALAALRSGDSIGCLALLDTGLKSIESAVLPRPLVHLRIAANEALGRHEPLLADLLYLRRDGDEAGTQDRIMEEYVRIGDLDRLRQEVELALDRSSLDPRRALSLAYVLRASAPATARRALLRATEDAVPPEAAGSALSLASELNVLDVRETMIRTVIANPTANYVTRFDRIEDVIAFMERSARDHRQRFGEWRKGRVPFAIVTAWDIETFGRMFLAEPAYRRDRLRDLFPMLLTSGARRQAPSPPPDGTILRPDLGALLVATRLGLLTHLEGAFTLQVPGSAAEALVELEAVFRRPSPEIIAAARNVLDGRGAVRIMSPLPADAVKVEDGETPGELSKTVVRGLLERAFATGHLDRETLESAASRLEAPEGETAVVGNGVIMTRLAITRLAGAEVLEQVARATACYLATDEAYLLGSDIADAVEDGRLRDAVEDLRRTLARKLAIGAWTTVSVGRRAEQEEERPAPAHVRCILEVLAAHENEPGWVWIEDRALSHYRVDGAVHLCDILQELHRRTTIGPALLGKFLHEIRRIGYAYLPIDASSFMSAIRAARMSDFGLEETLELADLRRWMAREIELLAEIEPREEFDAEGRVAGEGRRLLDVWGLARDLLVEIWEEPDTDVPLRVARSNWVWTNLRVDRIVGLPSDASPETRRTFRGLSLIYLLDVPLLAILDQSRPKNRPWREFIEWTMAAFGQSLYENDPEVRKIVVAVVARQLGDLLVEPIEGSAKERRLLNAATTHLVHNYLDLLPEDLSNDITDDVRVGPRLGTKTAMVLTVGSEKDAGGIQGATPLSEIVDAYGRALRSERYQETFRLLDGRRASIEIMGGDATSQVSFVIDGRKTVVDPLTAALLPPTASSRRIPKPLRNELCDPSGTITAEELDMVEATEEVDTRFALLQQLLDGNLDRTLRTMGERSAAQGTVRLSDFELPQPEAVLAHLRVPAGTPADVFVATAWSGLEAMPVGEASRRIASIPLGTPASDLGPRGDLHGGEAHIRMSPMLAAFDLLRLIESDPSETGIERGVAVFVSSLEHQAAFLTAVIRHLAAAAARNDAWRALDPMYRITLLWSHADQVVQHLALPGQDSRSIAHWLEGKTSFPFLDRVRESGMPAWYGRVTVGLTEVRLIAALVGRVVEAGSTVLSEAAATALRNICGTSSGGVWKPGFDLISPPPACPDILWVAADPLRVDFLGRWLSTDNPLRIRSDDGLATGMLDSEFGPDAAHLLGPLLSYVDVRNVASETADRIRAALVAGGGTTSFEPNMVATHSIMSLEAGLRALQGDETGMWVILKAEARRCAARWPLATVDIGSDDGAGAALAILVEAALDFALRLSRSMPERFGVFAEGVRVIVDAWPASRAAAAARLDAAVRLGGAEEASALWPVLLDLRGR